MRREIFAAMDSEVFKPVYELKLNRESEEEYLKVVLFDGKTSEMLSMRTGFHSYKRGQDFRSLHFFLKSTNFFP